MGLSDCLLKYVGTWITPPRNRAFNIEAQRYRLNKMNPNENYLEIQFESRPSYGSITGGSTTSLKCSEKQANNTSQ